MKIIPTATKKLNVRARTGPHDRFSCLFALSEKRNLLNKDDRNSSKAFPALMSTKMKMKINQSHLRGQATVTKTSTVYTESY
jgi:hypothetical protein